MCALPSASHITYCTEFWTVVQAHGDTVQTPAHTCAAALETSLGCSLSKPSSPFASSEPLCFLGLCVSTRVLSGHVEGFPLLTIPRLQLTSVHRSLPDLHSWFVSLSSELQQPNTKDHQTNRQKTKLTALCPCSPHCDHQSHTVAKYK